MGETTVVGRRVMLLWGSKDITGVKGIVITRPIPPRRIRCARVGEIATTASHGRTEGESMAGAAATFRSPRLP